VVVRYDKRGIGQSGGRQEHAGVVEYGQDVASIVAWLRKRRDIDGSRISLIGYGEGGAMALSAAVKDNKISGVALIAAPGTAGREFTLEQQRLSLRRSKEPESGHAAKIAMQQRIIDAVLTGRGWETLPEDVRYQADTAWFKSWLAFDPAVAVNKLKQPILIVHGALDREIPAAHADRLETMGRARRGVSAERTRKVVVPGLNHLLVTSTTGEVDEYEALPERTVSPLVTAAIVDWLKALPTLPK
jgi:pimeloyl-ACP methyl ester carboxylesterase